MQISIKDACRLLNVPERTLYRWIRNGSLPASRIGDDYRLDRVELIEWATRERISLSPEIFASPESEDRPPSMASALREGGVHPGIQGTDKESVLKAVVGRLNLGQAVDRAMLLSVLMAREALGSTGVGDGIAIPHARNPLILEVPRPQVALCYLDHAVDFAAIDGQPVSILFALLSPTVRAHLQLLSRLAFLLKEPEFREAVRKHLPLERIVMVAEQIESRIAAPAAAPPEEPERGLTRY
jgi:PTS system nitrogen regulatory IIA component